MVFKKIIFQNRYVALETPPPFMANAILNFHFDFLTPSLSVNTFVYLLQTYCCKRIIVKHLLAENKFLINLFGATQGENIGCSSPFSSEQLERSSRKIQSKNIESLNQFLSSLGQSWPTAGKAQTGSLGQENKQAHRHALTLLFVIHRPITKK